MLKSYTLNLFLIIQLFLFLISPLYSQHIWNWLNPKPQGNILTDCAIVHDSTIVVVGTSGAFFISFDKGKSWKDYYSTIDNSVNLNSVSFCDDNNGIVVGGFIISTTDGGKSWSDKYSVQELLCVDYLSPICAYATGYGGRFLKSKNKGINWTEVTTSTTEDLYGVSFINPDTGIVVGDNGIILRTYDGGGTWENISINNTDILRCVSMITENKIVIGGLNGALYRSTDGGTSWDKIIDPYLNVFSYSGISKADTNNIYACGGYSFTGSYCTIIKSTDGGANWSLVFDDLHPIHLSGISTYKEKVISVGFDGSIFSSENSSVNWYRVSTGNTSVIVDLDAKDSLNITTLARNPSTNFIYKTTDGGKSWSENILPTLQPLNSISFGNERNGMVVGAYGNIYKTSDAGLSWHKIDISYVIDTTKYLNSVTSIDSSTYYIVGDSGIVLKTTDGGNKWEYQKIGIYSLYDVSFEDSQSGYIIGWTKIYYTEDGGINWKEGSSNNTYLLWAVSAADNGTAYAVGDVGTLLKTTNGGKNWVDKSIITGHLFSVSFLNKEVGTIVGSFGRIYLTSDGGENWINLTGRTSNQLYSVNMVNSKTAIIGGESGSVIKFDFDIPTVIVEQENKIPKYFELKQNFPNPFNPSTTIEFSITKREFVKLLVYDILGREVKTLVNEEKPAGVYKVKFTADDIHSPRNLASGVYFYRINAGNYSTSKKMILLK